MAVNPHLIVGAVLGLIVATPCFGFNLQFLDDSPISKFNDKDVEIMLDTLTDALENAGDGVEVRWENTETGHHGSITPLNKITQDGMDCRRVDLQNVAEPFNGGVRYLLCKHDDGEWRVEP